MTPTKAELNRWQFSSAANAYIWGSYQSTTFESVLLAPKFRAIKSGKQQLAADFGEAFNFFNVTKPMEDVLN